MIAADRPDTVVLDVVLSDVSGLDLARELAAQNMPVLLISASPWTLDDPAARGLACLAKPFRMREFMVWVSETHSTREGRAGASGGTAAPPSGKA
jgi:DNA-binding response OmpR family regulator